jgi:hypothetical protein
VKNATVRSKRRVVALAAIFLSAPAQAQCDPADLFRAPDRQFTTGTSPYSVAIGDLDGDGTPDLAVANSFNGTGGNSVSVLLGNGDGTFRARQDFDTGVFPQSVSIGDLDGDGTPDLAVANYLSSTVSVLLGNGDGTFRARQDFATGSAPRSVAIGDLDGDGTPDLAVANSFNGTGGNSVSVLLGNGDGTFQVRQDFATGSRPRSVAIGDLDGDGTPDLAVVNSFDGTGGNSVSVLLGNGDGTFQARQDFATGSRPISVAIGDLDGDGTPDLAVANNDSHTVSVLLGNGDGTFQARQDFATGFRPISVAIGDLDGDAMSDLAVANDNSNSVSVLLGNGDGTFQARQDFATGAGPLAVAIGDLDGDAMPDLAVANYATPPPSACCWATATAPSRHARTSPPALAPWPSRSATSTETASPTSP